MIMKGNTFSTNKHSNKPGTDLMASSKNIDYSLIIQSIPSLLISLIGLALSGKILDMEQNKKYAETFPLLLLSNCILSFKGNTELIYAMYLSSSTQLKDHSTKTYLRFSFDNGCLLLLQSVIIGVSVGLLGLARNVIGNVGDKDTVPKMLAVCMLSSLFSTMIIMTLLIPSALFALDMGINPDNIVLPVIASVGDFIDITVLIMFIKKFQFAPNIACYLPIILILAITPVLVYYSVKSERMIPIQSMHVLIITYLFSTLSSYSIQIFSKRHKVLASSYPLFCGLTGASAYVYLNKKITSMQNSIPHNKERCFYSIIVASIIVAFFATLLMPILGIYFRRSYSILFVTGFVMTVGVLLKVIDLMMKLCKEKIEMAGVIGLPVIASVADLLSSLVVLSICFMVYGI